MLQRRPSGSIAPYPSANAIRATPALADSSTNSVGEYYFREFMQHLAKATGARHGLVARFLPPAGACTYAYVSHGQILDNFEYDVSRTPCEAVVNGTFCHHVSGVQVMFPASAPGIEGYLGTPLKAQDGQLLGHLCVFDQNALPAEPERLFNFQLYATRAAAELERLRPAQQQPKAFLDSNADRFRDLFEEAPIGYIFTDLLSRYVGANRTAMRILGLTQKDIDNKVNGEQMVANTPAMRELMQQAAEIASTGMEHSGVWEMRRKSDGQTVFIQLWTRPETNGKYIRTAFVDVTERVLLEHEQLRLKTQNVYLQEEIKSVCNYEEIIGSNHGLVEVLRGVSRVAATDATVLIGGETGTGKELIARAIHSASRRADKPFIKINCAALPAGLVESELFGHERGAFSGALQRRVGRFELANQGTLFLDEIGEIPLDVQVKLLRVLQEREFERVGSSQSIKTDIRIIAATNRDLPAAMVTGKFRSDLYYRLNVFPLTLPPLRQRRDDIPLLAHFFVKKYASRIGRRIEAIHADSMRYLTDYDWPGNIRELENIIERALILASSEVLEIAPEMLSVASAVLLPQQTDTATTTAIASQPVLPKTIGEMHSVQREHILKVLRAVDWIVEGENGAAKLLGMKPATLRHRMKKLGISRVDQHVH